MLTDDVFTAFSQLTTAVVCDACVRLGVPIRSAPPALRPVRAGLRLFGRVLPVRHYGSVDIFLRTIEAAAPGDVLVIDNAGRTDEACIGDLVVLEAQSAGIGGIVVWGAHRDTWELSAIEFPVMSCGECPVGPLRLEPEEADALHSVRFQGFEVGAEDAVMGDSDGVVFLPLDDVSKVAAEALGIWRAERKQAQAIREGVSLRRQLGFSEYMAKRSSDPEYTLRKHLKTLGGAIET